KPQSFSVTFGVGHPKVAAHVLLGGAPLLVTKHHHATPVKARDPGDDGWIIFESPITVQLQELIKQETNVVQRVRTRRVARKLYLLNRREFGKHLPRQTRRAIFQTIEFVSVTRVLSR